MSGKGNRVKLEETSAWDEEAHYMLRVRRRELSVLVLANNDTGKHLCGIGTMRRKSFIQHWEK